MSGKTRTGVPLSDFSADEQELNKVRDTIYGRLSNVETDLPPQMRVDVLVTLDDIDYIYREYPELMESGASIAAAYYVEVEPRLTQGSQKRERAASCLGVPLDCSVVTLDGICKLLKRRPDLFEDDWQSLPRNRKESTVIRRYDFFNVYEAIYYANYLGYVFNFEMTVSWQRGGYFTPDDVDIAFCDFIERFRKFCEYHETPSIYYSVFENGTTCGYHTHIHLHFPHDKQSHLIKWLKNTLVGADGGPFPKGQYEFRRHKDDHIFGQWQWFRYVMKDLDRTLTAEEALQNPPGVTFTELADVWRWRVPRPGPITIKRVRISKAVGPMKRWRAQYAPPAMFSLPFEHRYGSHQYDLGRRERDPLLNIEML